MYGVYGGLLIILYLTPTTPQLMKVKKFIQSLHKLPVRPSATGGKILLPDLVLQVDELNFQLLDDPYEVKLGTNFEVSSCT